MKAMSDRPRMRASQMRSNVESLKDLGAGVAERVRAEVPETLRELEASARTAWLPLELDVALTEAVERLTGRDRMRQWSADSIARSADGPLLGPIRQALRRMGLSGHSGLKRVEHIWGHIYRDCGRITYERGDAARAVVTNHDAPDEIMDSEAYLHGIAATLEGGLIVLGERDPFVSFDVDRAARRVRYVCRWRQT